MDCKKILFFCCLIGGQLLAMEPDADRKRLAQALRLASMVRARMLFQSPSLEAYRDAFRGEFDRRVEAGHVRTLLEIHISAIDRLERSSFLEGVLEELDLKKQAVDEILGKFRADLAAIFGANNDK